MARKREKLKDLDYHSTEYWNRLLVEEGLSMSRGSRPDKIVLCGDSQAIDRLQETLSQKETGRTYPKDRAD